MYTVKDLSEILNLTERQVYDRLRELDDLLESHLQRGKNNRVLVGNGALEILRRLRDLESEGLALKEAANRIRKELTSPEQDSDKTTGKRGSIALKVGANEGESLHRVLDLYERQIAFLKEQIAQKDRQIEALQDILRSRLPGSVATDAADSMEFDITYLQRMIAAQRQEIERLRRLLDEAQARRKPWWQWWSRRS